MAAGVKILHFRETAAAGISRLGQQGLGVAAVGLIVVGVVRRNDLEAVGAEVPAGGTGLLRLRLRHGVGGGAVLIRDLHHRAAAAVIGHAVGHHPRGGTAGEAAQSVYNGLSVHGQMEGQPDIGVVKGGLPGVQDNGAGAGGRLRRPPGHAEAPPADPIPGRILPPGGRRSPPRCPPLWRNAAGRGP